MTQTFRQRIGAAWDRLRVQHELGELRDKVEDVRRQTAEARDEGDGQAATEKALAAVEAAEKLVTFGEEREIALDLRFEETLEDLVPIAEEAAGLVDAQFALFLPEGERSALETDVSLGSASRIVAAASRARAAYYLRNIEGWMHSARASLAEARSYLDGGDRERAFETGISTWQRMEQSEGQWEVAPDGIKADPRFAEMEARLARLMEAIASVTDRAWTARGADPED